MSTDAATVAFLLDQLGAAFSVRRMFGEYCLYRDGRPVALVCDDTLYVKDTAAGRDAIAAAMAPEFAPPYTGARPHLRLAPDRWEDGDWLRRVLDVTAAALPPPKVRIAKSAAVQRAVATNPLSTSTNPTARPAAGVSARTRKPSR